MCSGLRTLICVLVFNCPSFHLLQVFALKINNTPINSQSIYKFKAIYTLVPTSTKWKHFVEAKQLFPFMTYSGVCYNEGML
jgi:hypothetical protein